VPIELTEEFRRGPGSRAFQFPLKFLEGDAARAADADAFLEEEAPLFLEPTAPSERNPAAAVDDAVPGKAVLVGGRVENPDDLAGGPVISGEGGDLNVGGDFAAGDRLDHTFDSVLEFHCLSCG
jgi:hypothetical protein